MQKIIGRYSVIAEFERLYSSGKPEFVAVYGRRRVGKTYLIRELFAGRMAFHHTGLSNLDKEYKLVLASQLMNFDSSLRRYGYQPKGVSSWMQAFDCLIDLLKEKIDTDPGKRLVVFIDELPWMDTPRSQFVSALEHFWNGWGAGQPQLMLIVCGSATSWIADNLIHNHGGLHGRLTAQIKLHPFTLAECEEYYKENGITLDRYSQLKLYMTIGGIPYYMSFVRKGKSLEQNTEMLFSSHDAKLQDELSQLFRSLFTNHEDCLAIARLLATRRTGFTRKEIATEAGVTYGGGLTKTLKMLEESDFIQSYTYYGTPQKETRYRLVDFFTIYWISVIENGKSHKSLASWFGFAFETLCWYHIIEIKNALGIKSVATEQFTWRAEANDEHPGAQIDLIIRRADRTLNICEIKFYDSEYIIDKDDDLRFRNRIGLYHKLTKCRETILPTIITTYGLTPNQYSNYIQNTITMDDLFVRLLNRPHA